LARQLCSSGWSVSGIGHGAWAQREAAQWGLDYWLNGDVGVGNLAQMERDCGIPEVVFHLAGGSSVGAALANPREDFRRTVVSTSELLEWMRLSANGSRLVAVSSAAVYGSDHVGPISEEASTLPFSIYGANKLMMEDLCRSYASSYGLRIALPRLFSVYGCGLRKQLLWDLCEKLASGKSVELGGSGSEMRDWIDVRDAVKALERTSAIASADAPCINLASGKGTTVRDVAEITFLSWAGPGTKLPRTEFNGRTRAGDPFSLVADVKAMHALDLVPDVPLDQGIADYVAWYRDLRSLA
jgi:UDP-glucose 4-epimerase